MGSKVQSMGDKDSESTKRNNKSARCKMCGAPLHNPKEGAPPFCSERCRMNDLSKWFGENYRIATNQAPQGSNEEEQEQEG